MSNHRLIGHLLALFTSVIWGTTFISTKVLLTAFHPVEILVLRFLLAWCALYLCSPKPLIPRSLKSELPFIGAGFTGLTLYFVFENTALTYTLASNAGIIVSSAPMFTALLLWLFRKGGRLGPSFFIGFASAMTGIILIATAGGGRLELNPLGDLLMLFAAFTWGVYAVFVAYIGVDSYSQLQVTRKIFFWGLLFAIPVTFFYDLNFSLARLTQPVMLGNMLYLALGASAVCFLAWNKAMAIIGPVATNVYIYLVPVITLLASALILQEPITPAAVGAIALILFGLWFSQRKTTTRIEQNAKSLQEDYPQTMQKGS